MDLEVSPEFTVPAGELEWRFSRSSGPGGQHVNTSDSRVQLSWNIAESLAVSEDQRMLLLSRLSRVLIDGVVTVSSSEQRSQLRNRETALSKLGELIAGGLAPDAAPRRATKRTRGSHTRRLAAKGERSETKKQRRPPTIE